MSEQEIAEFVGNRIKEERKKKGLTQKELGDEIGVKHNTISSYEKGTNAPEQNAIFRIANVLDIRVDDLFPNRTSDEFERAIRMADNLELKDMEFLNELIERALSMDEGERAKFLESIRFTVEYYDRMKKD